MELVTSSAVVLGPHPEWSAITPDHVGSVRGHDVDVVIMV